MRKQRLTHLLLVALLATGLMFTSAPVSAQKFPARPVTLLVPFAAGGGTDTKARILAPFFEKHLGGTVRVQVMPGAGSALGTRHVARSRPDGYMLIIAGLSSHVVKPLAEDVGYTNEDFQPLALMTMEPTVISVAADAPWQTMEELIAYANDNPGAIKYGTAGAGSAFHLFTEMAAQHIGIELTHVPFDGTSSAVSALLGGHIDAVVTYRGSVDALVQAGDLRMLVVGGAERFADLPGIPTYYDLGYDVETVGFDGVMAPAGLPDETARILEEALMATLNDPEFAEAFERTGAPLMPLGAAEFQRLYDRTYRNMGDVVRRVLGDGD